LEEISQWSSRPVSAAHCNNRDNVRRIVSVFGNREMVVEGQAFPKTVDDLKPVLDVASEFGIRHIDLQPDVRPRRLQDCIPLIDGWRRLGEEADIPVYIETHRDRMTKTPTSSSIVENQTGADNWASSRFRTFAAAQISPGCAVNRDGGLLGCRKVGYLELAEPRIRDRMWALRESKDCGSRQGSGAGSSN
jgi:hypothetical protein